MLSKRSKKYRKRSIIFLIIGLPALIISIYVTNTYLQLFGAANIFLSVWFGFRIIKDYFVTETEKFDTVKDD